MANCGLEIVTATLKGRAHAHAETNNTLVDGTSSVETIQMKISLMYHAYILSRAYSGLGFYSLELAFCGYHDDGLNHVRGARIYTGRERELLIDTVDSSGSLVSHSKLRAAD